jgi:multiple sugar transport system permease protein
MLSNRRTEYLTAAVLMTPFVVIYGALFVYPTFRTIELSLMKAPLIGTGPWVGGSNYVRLWSERLFSTAVWNTFYFVLLTVVPMTVLSLVVALGVNRLKGWTQSVVLAAFFLPYILPVSVVTQIWSWMLDKDFGIAQYAIMVLNHGQRLPVFRTAWLFMPAVAIVTIWWGLGFSVLLFIAGLRNISTEIYEAADLDGAGRWAQFWRITWPLIWPVTVLVFTIQLILQFKLFDQAYLLGGGGREEIQIALIQFIYKEAFQLNRGGLGAAASMILFVIIVALSVLQFQLLRMRGRQ